MSERIAAEVGEDDEPTMAKQEKALRVAVIGRKEKRKAAKKQKRKQKRREVALRLLQEEEAWLNDPREQMRMRLAVEEEAQRMKMERKEFEDRERLWIEAMEKKQQQAEEEEEEERQRKALEESEENKVENHNEFDEVAKWETVDEDPAEIIWQGNEIIVKKKKVFCAKADVDKQSCNEDIDRPTSNPLPPQSGTFDEYKDALVGSFDSVAQQIPNFGTEQDKAHCPFHFKTGACRFGHSCSRVHFYPDKSCTLLMKSMYSGPGLAWEQDEGLEHTDEEIECCYEEFYEDVHTEFLKFGEIVNFKVCKNGSSHLRGNVYVHYKSLDSALLACHSINGRYFAGKQVNCEFVAVTRWKVAICGEYMKSRMKTCSRGTACNFIHCFPNPGGDYEWANWDKRAPGYWLKKMAALFGYSVEYAHDKETEQRSFEQQRNSGRANKADADSCHSRRSRSRETDQVSHGKVRGKDHRSRKRPDEANFEFYDHNVHLTPDSCSDGDRFNINMNRVRHYNCTQKGMKRRHESDSDRDMLDKNNSRSRWGSRTEHSDIILEKNRSWTGETSAHRDFAERGRDGGRQRSSFRRKHSKHLHDDHWDGWSRAHYDDSEGPDSKGGNNQQDRVSGFSDDDGWMRNVMNGGDSVDRERSRRKQSRHRHGALGVLDDRWDGWNRVCSDDSEASDGNQERLQAWSSSSDGGWVENGMNGGDSSADSSGRERARHRAYKRQRRGSEHCPELDKKTWKHGRDLTEWF